MTPRPSWLTRFTAWFLNTSPEWVAPEEGESASVDSPEAQQAQADHGAGPAEKAPDPDIPPG